MKPIQTDAKPTKCYMIIAFPHTQDRNADCSLRQSDWAGRAETDGRKCISSIQGGALAGIKILWYQPTWLDLEGACGITKSKNHNKIQQPNKFCDEKCIFSKKVQSQDDRIGNNCRFKLSLDPFSLKNIMKSRNRTKTVFITRP